MPLARPARGLEEPDTGWPAAMGLPPVMPDRPAVPEADPPPMGEGRPTGDPARPFAAALPPVGLLVRLPPLTVRPVLLGALIGPWDPRELADTGLTNPGAMGGAEPPPETAGLVVGWGEVPETVVGDGGAATLLISVDVL